MTVKITSQLSLNSLQIERRVYRIGRWLLAGKSLHEIRCFASNLWGLSKVQVNRYINRALRDFKAEFKKKRRGGKAYHLARRRDLYSKALKAKDYRTCLAIVADISKLEGTYPEEKGKPLNIEELIIKIEDKKEDKKEEKINGDDEEQDEEQATQEDDND